MNASPRHTRYGFAMIAAAALVATGCSSGSSSGGGSAGTTTPTPTGTTATVTSTLDGLTALPQRIHWQAHPSVASADVASVDFRIDGKVGWTEHTAPYYYADDRNWLVTSFLTPGTHTFETVLTTTTGATVVDKVTATTSAPASPPAALAGSWQRHMTAADLVRAGVPASDGPPPGLWRYTFAPVGLIGHDPQNGGGVSDVRYLPNHRLQLRPTIEHPPYPSPNNGGFCDDTDPLAVYSYAISNGGRTLVLRPVTKDPCASRDALLSGTWTRTSPDKQAAALAAE